MKDHRNIDARSLAFGRVIAARLPEHPEHIARARATLARWIKTASPHARSTLEEWQTLLSGPLDPIVALLTGTDERSTRLRQSNPFAGVLPEKERIAIIREFHANDTSAT